MYDVRCTEERGLLTPLYGLYGDPFHRRELTGEILFRDKRAILAQSTSVRGWYLSIETFSARETERKREGEGEGEGEGD